MLAAFLEETNVGEIRSTIDLMMERTSGMTLSDDEKEEYYQDELKKKARGYRVKLLDSPTEIDQTLTLLDGESDKLLLEAFLWEELVDTLPYDHTANRYLDIMEKLTQANLKAAVLDEVRALLKSSSKVRSQDHKKTLTREKKKLASFGISGAAVLPKMPKDGHMVSEIVSQMDQLKKDLLKGIQP
jgi:hypothetical protein